MMLATKVTPSTSYCPSSREAFISILPMHQQPLQTFPFPTTYLTSYLLGARYRCPFPGTSMPFRHSWVMRFMSWDPARLPGFSDSRLFGWSYFTYTVDLTSQTRSSSETSFLRGALRQTTNLNLYKSTQMKKILLDDCKTATGVFVHTAGAKYTISAREEVILSAGSASHTSFFPA